MTKLGDMLANGRGVAKDDAEATLMFRKAAEAGQLEAMCALGRRYQNGLGVTKDPAEAARWARKAAEGGVPAGMWLWACGCGASCSRTARACLGTTPRPSAGIGKALPRAKHGA
jgi:TPR repeat protein